MVVLDGWGEISKPRDQHNHVSKIRLTHVHVGSALCLNEYISNIRGLVGSQTIGKGKRSSRSSWCRNIERRLRPSGWKCVSESAGDRSHSPCLAQLSVDEQRVFAGWHGDHFYRFRRIPIVFWSQGNGVSSCNASGMWTPVTRATRIQAGLTHVSNPTFDNTIELKKMRIQNI